MHSHAPIQPIVAKFCMPGWVVNSIIDTKFFWKLAKGLLLELQDTPKTTFPILNIHRPYNTVSYTMLHCEILLCFIGFSINHIHPCAVLRRLAVQLQWVSKWVSRVFTIPAQHAKMVISEKSHFEQSLALVLMKKNQQKKIKQTNNKINNNNKLPMHAQTYY